MWCEKHDTEEEGKNNDSKRLQSKTAWVRPLTAPACVALHTYINMVNQSLKVKQTHRYSEQTNYQCVVIRYIENKWVTGWFGVEWEVQTIGWKIGYKDVFYNTGNTANIS